ncbi:MAG: hypothetical protein JSS78_04505 [Bacteroidetes bacterium]|nr:hypothetical protein [Bacteroidota bacterium]
MRRFFLMTLFVVSSTIAQAISFSLWKEIPLLARMMTVDELGNIYVVRNDNGIVRYNDKGDSTGYFQSIQNGKIGSIDATNPLRILVYYPDYAKIVLLDRMLALKTELNLRQLNIAANAVVASSADGNIWIYDQFNARLRKVDEQMNEVSVSNDLRQEAHIVPFPSFMIERDWKVFLCDTTIGIITFDRYGNYINTLSIFQAHQLQVFGTELIFRQKDSLLSWDLKRVVANTLPLPIGDKPILSAAIVRSMLYVLYADRLRLFQINDQ